MTIPPKLISNFQMGYAGMGDSSLQYMDLRGTSTIIQNVKGKRELEKSVCPSSSERLKKVVEMPGGKQLPQVALSPFVCVCGGE